MKYPAHGAVAEANVRARILLKTLRSGNSEQLANALERIRRHPHFRPLSDEAILSDRAKIQLKHVLFVVAQELGFDSWEALKAFFDEEALSLPKPLSEGVGRFFGSVLREPSPRVKKTLGLAHTLFRQSDDVKLRRMFGPLAVEDFPLALLPPFEREEAEAELNVLLEALGPETLLKDIVVADAKGAFTEGLIRAGASKKKFAPSTGMLNFFEVEVRNEEEGGERPATLISALDSFQQAPDDVLLDWFSPPYLGVSPYVDEAWLPELDVDAAYSELQALIRAYGQDTPLMTLLENAGRNPFARSLSEDNLPIATDVLARYAVSEGVAEQFPAERIRALLEKERVPQVIRSIRMATSPVMTPVAEPARPGSLERAREVREFSERLAAESRKNITEALWELAGEHYFEFEHPTMEYNVLLPENAYGQQDTFRVKEMRRDPEQGVLFRGYIVLDPEDQAVLGDPEEVAQHELSNSDLLFLLHAAEEVAQGWIHHSAEGDIPCGAKDKATQDLSEVTCPHCLDALQEGWEPAGGPRGGEEDPTRSRVHLGPGKWVQMLEGGTHSVPISTDINHFDLRIEVTAEGDYWTEEYQFDRSGERELFLLGLKIGVGAEPESAAEQLSEEEKREVEMGREAVMFDAFRVLAKGEEIPDEYAADFLLNKAAEAGEAEEYHMIRAGLSEQLAALARRRAEAEWFGRINS